MPYNFVPSIDDLTVTVLPVGHGGVMVRASDLRSSGRGFDSRPGRYRAT